MTTTTIPTSPSELEEMLQDGVRMKDLFDAARGGDNKPFNDFIRNYSAAVLKKDSDILAQMREQTETVLAEFLQKERKSAPPVVFGKDGRPGVKGISKGRGAVYNKDAPGAHLERKYTAEEDRFLSVGEICQAIREEARPTSSRNRKGLLHKLDTTREFMNSFGSEEPSAGGFLIPEVMRSELLELALESALVRSRATVIPMSTLSVPIPTVDDTSHVSSLFGGVIYYWAEEAASIPESQAAFDKVTLTAKKLAGFFKVPNELLNDAPAFSAWFDTRIPAGLAWFEDLAFMTETGVGTPLGFINCPASVQVSAQAGQPTQTIVMENIAGMYARMLPSSLPNAVWIASIDTFPQLATMALSVGVGGAPVWLAGGMTDGIVQSPPMSIYGRPVYFTEKTPALGTTGDINFVDLSYYLIGDRQQVEVAASEHAFFQNDQTAYRIIERVDGRPWLQSALTPHNNSSNTLSPFVQLASR